MRNVGKPLLSCTNVSEEHHRVELLTHAHQGVAYLDRRPCIRQ